MTNYGRNNLERRNSLKNPTNSKLVMEFCYLLHTHLQVMSVEDSQEGFHLGKVSATTRLPYYRVSVYAHDTIHS